MADLNRRALNLTVGLTVMNMSGIDGMYIGYI